MTRCERFFRTGGDDSRRLGRHDGFFDTARLANAATIPDIHTCAKTCGN